MAEGVAVGGLSAGFAGPSMTAPPPTFSTEPSSFRA